MIKVGDYAIFRSEKFHINGFFLGEILTVGIRQLRVNNGRFNIGDEGRMFWVVNDLDQAHEDIADLNNKRLKCVASISKAKEVFETEIDDITSKYESEKPNE